MAKYPDKTTVRDAEKTYIVKKVAELHKVSPRHVYYVLEGKRENDEILKTYMDFKEGLSPLADAVRKLIPIN